MPTIYVSEEAKVGLPERRKFDFYPTERSLIRAALRSCLPIYSLFVPKEQTLKVLDTGAGLGVWGKELRELVPDAQITGVEINPDMKHVDGYNTWITGNYLKPEETGLEHDMFDLIIGNPPYGPKVGNISTSELFYHRSITHLKTTGYLLYLLPLQFICGVGRYERMFQRNQPVGFYPIARRPSFSGDGKTDATDYAIYVWKKNNFVPFETRMNVLNYERENLTEVEKENIIAQ